MSYNYFTHIYLSYCEGDCIWMKVRSFRLSDYESINNLLETVFDGEVLEQTRKAFARQLSWDSELVLVAECDGKVVGIMIGTIDKSNGYYYRVAVHPDYRRQGIGKSLIQAMKRRFQQKGIHRVLVPVDQYNEQLLSVFEKAGCSEKDFARTASRLRIAARL